MCCGKQATVIMPGKERLIDRGNPCALVTVDILELYLWKVDCVIKSGLYSMINAAEDECKAASGILQDWIADKQKDALSCTYQNYLPVMQDLVKRILLSSICK